MDVVAFNLDVEASALVEAETLLSPDELLKADRFVEARDRHRFIVARAHLKRELAARIETAPHLVPIQYGPAGKPQLGAVNADLHFNLSHSDEVAVIAFTKNRRIGIDVERIRTIPDMDRLATDHFSMSEVAQLQRLQPSQRIAGFFNCWTRKEAFVKALGNGLGYPLDSFDVSLGPDEPRRLLRVAPDAGELSDWSVESFVPAPGYVAAVVVESLAR